MHSPANRIADQPQIVDTMLDDGIFGQRLNTRNFDVKSLPASYAQH